MLLAATVPSTQNVLIDSNVVATLITAAVTVLTGVAAYFFTRRQEDRTRRLQLTIARIEQQLRELYGPLAIQVLEGERTFADLTRSLGRDHIFDEDDQLPANELQIWL